MRPRKRSVLCSSSTMGASFSSKQGAWTRGSGRYCVLPFLKEKRSDGDGQGQNQQAAVAKQRKNRQRLVIAEAAAFDLNVQDQGARHGADEGEQQGARKRSDPSK